MQCDKSNSMLSQKLSEAFRSDGSPTDCLERACQILGDARQKAELGFSTLVSKRVLVIGMPLIELEVEAAAGRKTRREVRDLALEVHEVKLEVKAARRSRSRSPRHQDCQASSLVNGFRGLTMDPHAGDMGAVAPDGDSVSLISGFTRLTKSSQSPRPSKCQRLTGASTNWADVDGMSLLSLGTSVTASQSSQ